LVTAPQEPFYQLETGGKISLRKGISNLKNGEFSLIIEKGRDVKLLVSRPAPLRDHFKN